MKPDELRKASEKLAGLRSGDSLNLYGKYLREKNRAAELEAELAEAEKELHECAAGEEKEWERAEKAEAEVERLVAKIMQLRKEAKGYRHAELAACQERVRELTAERNGLKRELDAWARVQTKEGGE